MKLALRIVSFHLPHFLWYFWLRFIIISSLIFFDMIFIYIATYIIHWYIIYLWLSATFYSLLWSWFICYCPTYNANLSILVTKLIEKLSFAFVVSIFSSLCCISLFHIKIWNLFTGLFSTLCIIYTLFFLSKRLVHIIWSHRAVNSTIADCRFRFRHYMFDEL